MRLQEIKRSGVLGVGLMAFGALAFGRLPTLFVFVMFIGGLWQVLKAADLYAKATGSLALIRSCVWGLGALVVASVCCIIAISTSTNSWWMAASVAFLVCGLFFCAVGVLLWQLSGFVGFFVGSVLLCAVAGLFGGLLQDASSLLYAVFTLLGFGLHAWGWWKIAPSKAEK